MARNRTAGTPETETTFEQAMSELEEIVHSLEDGTLPLDQLVEKYERGSGLLKVCRSQLDAAQQRIEIIKRNAAGGVDLESPGDAAAAPKSARKTSSSDHANSDEIRLF